MHKLNISKQGYFIVDDKFTFEIGGAKKSFEQIKNMPNSFIAADDIEVGSAIRYRCGCLGFCIEKEIGKYGGGIMAICFSRKIKLAVYFYSNYFHIMKRS